MLPRLPCPLRSRMMLLGAGSSGSGAAAGTAEKTQIVCLADVRGNRHGKYFTLADQNGSVEVWFNLGYHAEITSVEVVNPGASYATAGEGAGFAIAVTALNRVAFWFNTGTETVPDFSGDAVDSYVQVDISSGDSATQVATTLAAAVAGIVGTSPVQDGATIYITNSTTDEVNAPNALTSTCNVTRVLTGGPGASPPVVADRDIEVNYSVGDSASAIATALQAALDADAQFSATRNTATVTATDAAVGARTDAADVDTGFTITTTQQGT